MEKDKAISAKVLTKDLVNGHQVLSSAKYFSSGLLQSYLVLLPAKNYIKYLTGTTQINSWKSNGMSPTLVDH